MANPTEEELRRSFVSSRSRIAEVLEDLDSAVLSAREAAASDAKLLAIANLEPEARHKVAEIIYDSLTHKPEGYRSVCVDAIYNNLAAWFNRHMEDNGSDTRQEIRDTDYLVWCDEMCQSTTKVLAEGFSR